MINVFQPSLGKEELSAVEEVFDSNWIGRGPKTDQFEKSFAQFLRVEHNHIKSISCCTEGLFQSMKLIDIQPGDEVILPSISFVGAANAILDAKGVIVFADVDPHTLNLTLEEIKRCMTPKTKAVCLLHYGGVPCEMDDILEFCHANDILLIEDNACSPVSQYKGRACGTLGDIGLWSFDAMKILVTGDGGMVYCKDPQLAEQLGRGIYLGLLSKSGYLNPQDNRWWAFDIDQPGRRAIMNDISSAIGLVQLKKLPGFIERRKKIHEMYDAMLQDIEEVTLPPSCGQGHESSYYFYRIRLNTTQLRDQLAFSLKASGVYVTFRYYPLHLVPFFDCKAELCPNATYAAQHDLCLPIHQSLSDSEVERVAQVMKQAICDLGVAI